MDFFPPNKPDELQQPPRAVARRAFLFAAGAGALGFLVPGKAQAYDWKIVNINDRDYVSFKDMQSFYRFSRFERDGRHLWLRSQTLVLKAQMGSDELYMNSVKFVLSYPITEKDGEALVSRIDLAKLLDPVMRPNYIANAVPFDTVVLDAGHGAHDTGAKGVYGWEKDYTLDLAFRVKKFLEAGRIKVKLTRDSDIFIERIGRYKIANETPNCIFVSLQFNSSPSRSAVGLETYALSPTGTASTDQSARTTDGRLLTGNTRDAENIALATAVHASALFRLKAIDRGIKRARWTVLTGLEKPGILFEGGFITNETEGAKIHKSDHRDLLAKSIAEGVLNYRNAIFKRQQVATKPKTTTPTKATAAGNEPTKKVP